MAIPSSLLSATDSRAPGVAVYGGAGLKKTNAIATLPPPILHLDIGEGGSASVLPWIARRRDSSTKTWTTYTPEQREGFLKLLDEDTAKARHLKSCGAYIDVVHFDNTRYDAYEELAGVIGNLDTSYYNSVVVDSLQELSVQTQTKAKGNGENAFMRLMTDVPFGWVAAQERAFQALRRLRNYRDGGIFVYLIGSEAIAKDYVKNPMAKQEPGAPPPEAYSIRGTVDLPGALANGLSHIPDILCRAKLMNGAPWWVTEPEMLPGGGAHWDAKDRYGRLPRYIPPNFREMCKRLYGQEGYEAIYTYALERVG